MTDNLPVTFEARFAQDAQRMAEAEPLNGGTWLTVKGGQLMIGEVSMPGNQALVVVVDSVRENTYYGAKYDPDSPMPPICYALARDNADQMFPHLDMQKDMTYFQPQHIEGGQVLGCSGCPLNEWGSASEGRGKACQNRRRLTLIPAGYYTPRPGSRDFDVQLFDDQRHFAQAEVAYMKLPVTSVNNWAKYVNQLSANVRRPPYGVVTRIFLEPHQKHQYEVNFECVDIVPDGLAETVITRHDAAERLPIVGYTPPDAERKAANSGSGSISGLRGGAR